MLSECEPGQPERSALCEGRDNLTGPPEGYEWTQQIGFAFHNVHFTIRIHRL